jgi:PPOX class probable F420-dependent enzyme
MSRRDQIGLTREEALDFLRASKTMTIVSNGPKGYPHPMPMWFVVDDDMTVRMTTFRRSQKVKNLERDPRVSLLVESGTEYQELKGVVIYGRAEIIQDMDVIKDTLLRAASNDAPAKGSEGYDAMLQVMSATAAKRVCLQVRPERVVSWDHRKLGGVY